MQQILVEFYGTARLRAGVSHIQLAWHENRDLDRLWQELSVRFPDLLAASRSDGRARDDYLVSLDGDRFVQHRDTPIRPGQSVLIMSPDAGG